MALNTTEMFTDFVSNLAIDNVDTISLRYGEITCALNQNFRDTSSKTANSLQVGSYGRWTAIKGISDLDMLYILPASEWSNYKNGGQSKLLKKTKEIIQARYPSTDVFVDRLVVRVLYQNFHIEVQPVFELEDESFRYPDTKDGGKWKNTKPRLEIKAMSDSDADKNKNLRRLCKMLRAWKNQKGVQMGGLLIDTLAHNFLNQTTEYDAKSYASYPDLMLDMFTYLSELPEQDYFAALGSGQRVAVKKKFQPKSKKAHKLCQAAIDAKGQKGEYKKWRKLFGKPFPVSETVVAKSYVTEGTYSALDTEKYIEDMYPIDIRHNIKLDCEITQHGFRPTRLRLLLAQRFPLKPNKNLKFTVTECDVPGDFVLYWKVLNRGFEAIKRKNIRGEIKADMGNMEKNETANFRGNHVVECFAVLNGVVVARDRILVPIDGNSEDE